ncbi:MAG: biopolymer transporter ExbD [Bacteroidota bacterium]|nr:biopolymer transporter ExbD [Bacteroidota bacterium]
MGKKTPQINSSSTADIAFLLLCYFLMTTTMDQQLGIERQMPPMQTAEKLQNQKAHKRNLLQVKISAHAEAYVQGGTGYFKQVTNDIDLIREIAYEFFGNGLRNIPRHLEGRPRELNISDELLPEREVTDIPEFAKFNGGSPAFAVSKGIISLQYNVNTSYETFIAVQNALVAGVNEVRRAFCQEYLKKDFEDLTKEELDRVVKKAIPQNISESDPKDTEAAATK